jgi:hypothetical protein
VHEQLIRVECYSGYKAEEVPANFICVSDILRLWISRTAGIHPGRLTFAFWLRAATVTCFAIRKSRTCGVSSYSGRVVGQFPVT